VSGELEVSALRGCPYCSRYMRWDQLACDECSGASSRRSYRERTGNLVACITAAAVEEARYRHTIARLWDEPVPRCHR